MTYSPPAIQVSYETAKMLASDDTEAGYITLAHLQGATKFAMGVHYWTNAFFPHIGWVGVDAIAQ